MKTGDIIILGSRDVRGLLSIEDCIPAVEEAFRLYGEGRAQAPGVLGMHVDGGGFHIKAGLLDLTRRYFAAKVNGNFPGNPSRFGASHHPGRHRSVRRGAGNSASSHGFPGRDVTPNRRRNRSCRSLPRAPRFANDRDLRLRRTGSPPSQGSRSCLPPAKGLRF